MNNMIELIRDAMKSSSDAMKNITTDSAVLDGGGPTLQGADEFTVTEISMEAVAAIQQWAETDDLDEGETYADRLLALMVGIADGNHDGEVTEDEQGVLEVALNSAWDYLVSLGASEEDASALLNDFDPDTADRVRELVLSALPEGDDGIDTFMFGSDATEPALDAVYRKTMAIRKGKKVRINKRISGTVRLNAKQKLAIRKAGMKSRSAGARMRRMKSVKLRKKMGL